MGHGVFALDVVQVVGGHEGKVEFFRESDQLSVDDPLFVEAVILKLEVEVVLAEQFLVELDLLDRLVELARKDEGGNLSRQAGRGGDEAPGVCRKKLVVDARLVVEAFGEGARRQLEQVVVALHVLCDQEEVPVFVAVFGASLLLRYNTGGVSMPMDSLLPLRSR